MNILTSEKNIHFNFVSTYNLKSSKITEFLTFLCPPLQHSLIKKEHIRQYNNF